MSVPKHWLLDGCYSLGIITENQWKITLKPSTPLFKKVRFSKFWLCPATFGFFFHRKNSWNQLNNWQKSSLQIFTNTVIYLADNFIINQIFTFDKKNNIWQLKQIVQIRFYFRFWLISNFRKLGKTRTYYQRDKCTRVQVTYFLRSINIYLPLNFA
jgi:hypothetical protein